ncbi:MAG: PadR family transcriptional regulator [Promethearchaeota archaeon]
MYIEKNGVIMIKHLRNFGSETNDPMINNEVIRKYLESFESELSRGLSTLIILRIIKNFGDEGIYGYQILKELERASDQMLILEEGRLYPLLRKLEHWGPAGETISLINSRKEESGRKRKFYSLTEQGFKIYNHLEGYFSKLITTLSPLLPIEVKLDEDEYLFCPNCANKIDLDDNLMKYCPMCGLDIQNLRLQKQGGIL